MDRSPQETLRYAQGRTIVVEKTLPVKTAKTIKEILYSSENNQKQIEILSNPEFLAEGSAINDYNIPIEFYWRRGLQQQKSFQIYIYIGLILKNYQNKFMEFRAFETSS